MLTTSARFVLRMPSLTTVRKASHKPWQRVHGPILSCNPHTRVSSSAALPSAAASCELPARAAVLSRTALQSLHTCAASSVTGEGNLLAVVHSSASEHGVGGISVINRYFGRDHIDIGAYKGPIGRVRSNTESPWGFTRDPPLRPWEEGPYAKDLVDTFPGARIQNATQAPSSLSVLRKQLAKAAPNSVKIVTVGYAINILELLRSKPDQLSSLDGVELVKTKVSELVFMGGRRGNPFTPWWEDHELEGEWNFCGSTDVNDVCGGKEAGCGAEDNLGQVTHDAIHLWPKKQVPITYLNFETGADIWTGGVLSTTDLLDISPCSRGYQTFCTVNEGWCHADGSRQSWDPQAVLYAVRGTEELYDVEPGSNKVDPKTCGSEWTPRDDDDDDGAQPQSRSEEYTLVLKKRGETTVGVTVGQHIDQLLLQQPRLRPPPPPPPLPPLPPPPPPPPPSPTPPPPSPSLPLTRWPWPSPVVIMGAHGSSAGGNLSNSLSTRRSERSPTPNLGARFSLAVLVSLLIFCSVRPLYTRLKLCGFLGSAPVYLQELETMNPKSDVVNL